MALRGTGLGTLRQDLRGWPGYVLAVAAFLLAWGATSSTPWFQTHYPYVVYMLAGLATCYAAGLWPAVLAAALSTLVVFLTHHTTPPRMFVEHDDTPAASVLILFAMIVACCAALDTLIRSRDRIELERERYARLAESRDLLYREMQHRVSNNIQIVGGLLRLQSQGVSDPAAQRALIEASSRISLIARIQRQLHDASGEPAPFRTFAEELLADALKAAGADRIKVEIEGGEDPLHAEQATPVSLVLLECVNNALEHAYAPGHGGVVKVALRRNGETHTLTVRDDGLGVPEGFDPEQGKSLGLKIVRTMAAQLNGDFSITSQQPGALCRLHFPNLGSPPA